MLVSVSCHFVIWCLLFQIFLLLFLAAALSKLELQGYGFIYSMPDSSFQHWENKWRPDCQGGAYNSEGEWMGHEMANAVVGTKALLARQQSGKLAETCLGHAEEALS